MRVILSIVLMLLTLHSRENPFFPTDSIDDMPITSNKIEKYPPLNRIALSFPDYARVLQEVSISYKNLDGTVEKRSIKVNRSVDWHIPLFISQSYMSSEKQIKVSKKISPREIDFKFIDFSISKKEITIKTEDKMKRHFLLINPHRIVLDFIRDADFLSYKKILKRVPFTLLRMGNHEGYYRVVIDLDGHYRYSIDSIQSGYKIRIF